MKDKYKRIIKEFGHLDYKEVNNGLIFDDSGNWLFSVFCEIGKAYKVIYKDKSNKIKDELVKEKKAIEIMKEITEGE